MTREEHLRAFAEVLPDMEDKSLIYLLVVDSKRYDTAEIDLATRELTRRGLKLPTSEEYYASIPKPPFGHFCEQCFADTVEESSGGTFILNFLYGTRITSSDESPCRLCGSVIAEKWFYFIIPIYRMGRYRVIRINFKQYRSRRLFSDKIARQTVS